MPPRLTRRSILAEQAVADIGPERHAGGILLKPRPFQMKRSEKGGFGLSGDCFFGVGAPSPGRCVARISFPTSLRFSTGSLPTPHERHGRIASHAHTEITDAAVATSTDDAATRLATP